MKNFHFLTVLAILLFSCQESPLIPNSSDMERTLVLDFKTAEFEDGIATRSFDEINDLDIFIFDNDGNKIHHRHFDNYDNTSAHFILPRTPYSIAVIANTNNEFSDISTLDEAKAITVDTDNEALSYFEENLSADAPDNASGSVTHKTIELKRTFAKVTVAFNYSNLNSGITITPQKITVKTTPKECSLFSDNSIKRNTTFNTTGASTLVSDINATHTTATPLYALENLQGTSGSINTPQKDKTPDEEHTGLCTYLEIEATYENPEGSRPITYRYYLGENTTNDFNVKRNYWYKVSIDFKGDGGYDENSWRVTVSGTTTLIIYLPYVGRRTYSILLDEPHAFYTNDYNDQDFTWRENGEIGHLFLEDDFDLNGRNYIAHIKTKTSVTKFLRLPEQQTVIITDITALHFPHNSTFGFTSYPITKHINFFTDTDIPTHYSISSTAEWLHFGDGDTFKAFSSYGNASTASTNDMYNSGSGKVVFSNFPSGYIAVRCSENTTTEPRYGNIRFYDPQNQCVTVILVAQNPSTYPTSPTHLSKVDGGWYTPGAWLSDGTQEAASDMYEYNSTTRFWERESAFYTSTTEITALEFCDFLNDLSITNSEALNSQSFGALDKCGSPDNDYLGLLPPWKQNSSFTFNDGTTIERNGSLWQPRQIYASRNETTPYTHSLLASNYPIDNISMFTAADYNYWAADRASKTFNRASDPLLITELEWEAAARAIDNNGDWQAANYNGLYPYPLLSLDDNNLLHSNMTSTSPNATIKKFSWHCDEVKNGAISSTSSSLKYPVALLLPNRASIFDLGGNVREWCYDLANWQLGMPYSSLEYDNWYPGTVETDIAKRIFRGGNAQEPAHTTCVTYRGGMEPNTTTEGIGIRLVIR